MGRIQTGDFSARVEERGTREMIMLARSFNAMGAEIDELMGRVALKERETLRAELLALRLQINPHFLYNTLDVMRGMALAGGATEAAEIARSLAALLRYSTVKDSDHVQVRDELGSLRHYLKIQKHRFGSRFTMRIRVEPDVAASLVPRFILQPLVENAFLHAVERSLMRLALLVSIHAEADDLLVEVIDNGAGMGEQELSAIQGSLLQGMESANTGIGLQNVHNRIRLAYGPGYGVSIESSQGRGTRVVVRLPRKIRPNGSI
jgi:two-component system sensor histidine kinase YesM